MNDYPATPVQWSRLQQRYLGGNDLVCAVLELHARVEALDKRCGVQLMQLSDLQERHHRLTLQVGHLEHELVRDDDEPQQYCLEAMDPPEANSKPTPNPSQIRSSLVKRVAATLHRVTDSDPNVPVNEWKPEARAAIREVAAWLDANSGGTRAAWMLTQEINQPTSQEDY
jgi:hypothetical protein